MFSLGLGRLGEKKHTQAFLSFSIMVFNPKRRFGRSFRGHPDLRLPAPEIPFREDSAGVGFSW